MVKSRRFFFHPDTNEGKIRELEELLVEYRRYLQACINLMIAQRRMKVSREEILSFFPVEKILITTIVQSCQNHAKGIVLGWVASRYSLRIKKHIQKLFREKKINEETKIKLFTIGKWRIDHPTKWITQETIDLYWSILLDPEISGRTPQVSNRIGMRTQLSTSEIKKTEKTEVTELWLEISGLTKRKRIQIPLVANPHITSLDQIKHGWLVRKDKRGRWCAEVLERAEYPDPVFDPELPRKGIDVGLNVIAAVSDGRLFGENFKPDFNKLYDKVTELRRNLQRQGIKENTPKLDYLEDKLSGMIKTAVGNVANKLVKAYPKTVFTVEDLDLSGCRGQKRFAYRALHHALARKAPTVIANAAYTSQPCPSCDYVSRKNRNGTKFICRSCGKKAHADFVGSNNVVKRFDDKEINLYTDYKDVGALLRKRYVDRRNKRIPDSSLGEIEVNEFVRPIRKLTTRVSKESGTALNLHQKSQVIL